KIFSDNFNDKDMKKQLDNVMASLTEMDNKKSQLNFTKKLLDLYLDNLKIKSELDEWTENKKIIDKEISNISEKICGLNEIKKLFNQAEIMIVQNTISSINE